MTDAKLAVLVVSYGSHAMVDENLARTPLPEGALVVVVDNFTTDAERAAMRRLSDERGWDLVAPERNLGFGEGMNAAAARAENLGASVFLLLNPDAYLPDEGVARLASQVAADPDLLLAPSVSRPDGSHFSSEMELDLATGSMRRIKGDRRFERSALWLSGACLAVSRELWDRVGGFDDDYFLYWEDIDLSVRVAEAGGHLAVDHEVTAVHSAGGTQVAEREGQAKSPVYYYYNVRNRLVFATQHLEERDRRRWRRRSIPAAWQILMRGGRRQLLHPSRTLLPALKGTVAGLRYGRTRVSKATQR